MSAHTQDEPDLDQFPDAFRALLGHPQPHPQILWGRAGATAGLIALVGFVAGYLFGKARR